MITQLVLLSLVGGFFSLVGGSLLLIRPQWTNKIIHVLLAFAAGSFLAAALLDILPEALEMSVEPHPVFIWVLVGFTVFFVLERLLMSVGHRSQHDHDHSNHTESLSFLIVLGDCIHNVIDGLVIGLAFVANPMLALPTALAVAAHEVPQEVADFSILLKLGWKRSRVIGVNIIQSLLTIPGVLIGYYAGQILTPYLPFVLGATAGVFIYIASSDLIPELHHLAGHKHFAKTVLPFILALLTVYWLVSVSHH